MVQTAVRTSLRATIPSVSRSSGFATERMTAEISPTNKTAVSHICVYFTRFVHDLLSSPTAPRGYGYYLRLSVCLSVCFSERYLKDRCS